MKKNIALVTGGLSGEAVISYKSADSVLKNIDSEKYNCYLVDIRKDGWFCNIDKAEFPIDKNNFSVNKNGEVIIFDSALIILHGTPGEDGKIQGYFECIGMPYTSCDTATSAITFNKKNTIAIAAMAGINVAKSLQFFKNDSYSENVVISSLKFPVFVKPNNGGSSLGISKVLGKETLNAAVAKAFKEDDQIIIEEYIKGRELTIGVYKKQNEIIPLPATEILSKNDFFDFEAKYNGASEEITPAKIGNDVVEYLNNEAIKVYKLFNCRGVVRIDFILCEENGKLYMLEINTVPGQSAASIVPQQVLAMGLSLKEFYSSMIEESFNNGKK